MKSNEEKKRKKEQNKIEEERTAEAQHSHCISCAALRCSRLNSVSRFCGNSSQKKYLTSAK